MGHALHFIFVFSVESQKFQLQPLNRAVLQGSDVQFSSTVEGNWQVMTWHVRGFLVLTVPADNNVTSSSPQFSARFCSAGDPRCVEFTIHNVTRKDAGPVMCTVQGEYGSKTAQLSVQGECHSHISGCTYMCSICRGGYKGGVRGALNDWPFNCPCLVLGPKDLKEVGISRSEVSESGTVNILGGNMTVDQDQQVEFQCVTTAWFPIPTISWTQNSHAINSSLYNTSSVKDGDYFNSTSVLKFQAVRNTMVECQATVPALTNPQSSSVSLVVVPKPPDWTVLIAVVVSFGGLALLVLVIIGIIFCCKRRKEKQSNYQDEMRRVRTQSQISTVSAAGLRRAQVNAGFVPEGQTSIAPSELTDSDFCQANGPNVFEMPDILNTSQTGNSFNRAQHTVDGSGFRKHRHVTIV
nr:PREDICTED: immunoglobulin superfamily member 5-like [Paralichthys olivaceus]